MAEQESTVVAFDLAKQAVDQASAAYEFAFEIQEILRAFSEPDEPPVWAFTLLRMAQRACSQADSAYAAAIRVRASLQEVHA